MNNPKDIHIADFNYQLDDKRIAKYPLPVRDESKLLVYKHGEVSQDIFRNVYNYLPENALMIFNNTRVIQARMHFRKDNPQEKLLGALIEIFLLEPYAPRDYERIFSCTGTCGWLCLVGNLKRWKDGPLHQTVVIDGKEIELTAERGDVVGTSFLVTFTWNSDTVTFAQIIDAVGEIPIPPYLNRDTEEKDKTTYQTVYARIKGSVAAPTAGLHFTPQVLANIDAHKVEREEVTLHVGAGTFRPVKSEDIGHHEMHTETISVRLGTIKKLIAHGGRAVAVGTTSVRTLESLYYIGVDVRLNPALHPDDINVLQWEPYDTARQMEYNSISTVQSLQFLADYMEKHGLQVLNARTQIIIAPGYRFHIVERMITNFHQPQSTLLLLVSAFVNGDWKKIYDYALEKDFRFLSYGDSSILIP